MNTEQILKKAEELLAEEQRSIPKDIDSYEKLSKYILPALEKNKSTLASLYQFAPKTSSSFLGRIKAKILSKLRNITINVVERESMKQQKYNELVYQALTELYNLYDQQNNKK